MPNIQFARELKSQVMEAQRQWASELPRQPGQLGGTITNWAEGPPVYTPGEIPTYSDFEPIRLLGVPAEFVAYLRKLGSIPFTEN